MVQQRFSSTEREMRTLIYLLQWIQDQTPVLLQKCRLQHIMDRQDDGR